MSHTTTIKNVPIKSIPALKKAVEALQQKGIDCNLKSNKKPRMYYPDQCQVCDYVLALNNSKYDVGFLKNDKNEYQVLFDTWNDYVAKEIGATCQLPNTAEEKAQHALGQLLQEYSKHVVIEEANNQGYIITDSYTDEEGNYQIICQINN